MTQTAIKQSWVRYTLGVGIEWSSPSSMGYSEKEQWIVDHAMHSYGFVLNHSDWRGKTINFREFASRIEAIFSLENSQTRQIVELLRRS